MTKSFIRPIGLLALSSALLLSGCQSDPADPVEELRRPTLELVPYANSLVDVQPWSASRGSSAVSSPDGWRVTRADYEHLPSGYVPYNDLYPAPTPNHSSIGVFMTPESTSSVGNFIYLENIDGISTWKSNVAITAGTDYYVYGFMPREDADNATITMLDGATDWSAGAKLSISGFNTLTAADVCAVVGVRKAAEGEKIAAPATDVPLGSFSYRGDAGKNYAFVLLKHLYAGLHFKAHIDAEYYSLRTIRVTGMALTAEGINNKIDLSLTITANSTNTDPLTSVSYAPSASSTMTGSTVTLFPYSGGPESFELPVTTPESFVGCFVPGISGSFVLTTTFDVYDKKGNLTRKGCVAENKFTSLMLAELSTLGAGEIYTIDLLVKPTYLYVLSHPDLDNPSITLN